jgi:demethoxyubiquinone hydroxylase (CLK1/Coq7/Cat5 family)
MPSQDEIMKQILGLVGEGACIALTPEVESALHERYYKWIVEIKKENSTSPQDIWDDKDGEKLQQKFRDIGRHMAQDESKLLDAAGCKNSCLTVERLSDCPHCPDI